MLFSIYRYVTCHLVSLSKVRDDVVRSGMANNAEELPESGYTKNLMNRFSSIEEQNKPVTQHTPSGVGNKVRHNITFTKVVYLLRARRLPTGLSLKSNI